MSTLTIQRYFVLKCCSFISQGIKWSYVLFKHQFCLKTFFISFSLKMETKDTVVDKNIEL